METSTHPAEQHKPAHPTEQSTVIMFNRRMFYALSILKIERSLAHQLAYRTNFSKPPSHNRHWQGKLHRRGNTRCRGPRGEGSNMNLQASAFSFREKTEINYCNSLQSLLYNNYPSSEFEQLMGNPQTFATIFRLESYDFQQMLCVLSQRSDNESR